MPQSVKTLAKEVGANQYAICGNGTIIYDLQKEEIIYDAFMEKEKVLNIIKICEQNSIYYNIYTTDEVITKTLNFNTLFYDKENSKECEKYFLNKYQNYCKLTEYELKVLPTLRKADSYVGLMLGEYNLLMEEKRETKFWLKNDKGIIESV